MRSQRGFVAALGAVTPMLAGCGGPVDAAPAAPERPTDDRDAVLSGLAFFPLAAPEPVAGADGRLHLAYEFVTMNQSASTVALQKIEALDAAGGQVLPVWRVLRSTP